MALPKNSETISITVKSWLLELIDRQSERSDLNLNRSQFFQRAARRLLLAEMDLPETWKIIYKEHTKDP